MFKILVFIIYLFCVFNLDLFIVFYFDGVILNMGLFFFEFLVVFIIEEKMIIKYIRR